MAQLELEGVVRGRRRVQADADAAVEAAGVGDRGRVCFESIATTLYGDGDPTRVEFDLAADPAEERPTEVEGATRAAVVRRLQAFRAYQRAAFPD